MLRAKRIGAFGLTANEAAFTASVGLQRQTDIGPELWLGAKVVRCPDQSNQESCADGSDRRNLTQQFHRETLSAFSKEFSPHLLTQGR
jgi:hypothetical protein